MKINFDFWVISSGASIVLGVFAALLLWFRKDRYLALLVLTISLWLIHNFYSVSGIFKQDPNYYFRPIYYSLAFGPLIFFYTHSLTNTSFKFKAKHLLHFIPVLFQACLYCFLFFKDYAFKNWFWHNWHSPITYRLEFILTFLSLVLYTILSLILLRAYQIWLKNNFSEASKITLNWLRIVLGGFLLLSIFWLVELILREVFTVYDNYTVLTLGVLTLILTIGGLLQEKSKVITFTKELDKKVSINDENLILIRSRMEENKDYLNPTLTLKEFAENCSLPSRTISEHINKGLGKTFHDYVNEFRVLAVKEKLEANFQSNFTLEAIAYDCGFNSKATFNRIFKKFTGVSPGKWKDMQKS